MRSTLLACLGGVSALFLSLPSAAAQSAGLPPEWEVRKELGELLQRLGRFQPILEQTSPQEWTSRGAPAAYADQAKRIHSEIEYLGITIKALSDRPGGLTAALDTFFRMQSLDLMLRSYEAGIRRYQNPAVADLLQGVITETAADREKLRQYAVDLAAAKEEELRIMDEEAQRCRGLLLRQPARKEERH